MLYILTIFDRKAASYGRPLFCRAIGEGMRIFRDEVNRPAEDNVLYRHPEDFDLFHVGLFDDETGRIKGIDPVLLDSGTSLKEAGHVPQPVR